MYDAGYLPNKDNHNADPVIIDPNDAKISEKNNVEKL